MEDGVGSKEPEVPFFLYESLRVFVYLFAQEEGGYVRKRKQRPLKGTY